MRRAIEGYWGLLVRVESHSLEEESEAGLLSGSDWDLTVSFPERSDTTAIESGGAVFKDKR